MLIFIFNVMLTKLQVSICHEQKLRECMYQQIILNNFIVLLKKRKNI